MANYDEKLIRMANQIATFFDSQKGDAAESVAQHLRDFWDPSMRARARALAGDPARSGALSETARTALARLPATPEGEGYPLTDGRILTQGGSV